MADVSSIDFTGYSTANLNANKTKTVSTSSNPSSITEFTAEANDKNTLTIQSYFKLLAAQLANQDMTNPMDSSDIMNQLSQMAMVQSLTSMTTSIKDSMTMNKTTYAASLIGKSVTAVVTDEDTHRSAQYQGVIQSVNLAGDTPTVTLSNGRTVSIDDITEIGGSSGTSSGSTGSSTGNTESIGAKAVRLMGKEATLSVKNNKTGETEQFTGTIKKVDTDSSGRQRVTLIDADGNETIYYVSDIAKITSDADTVASDDSNSEGTSALAEKAESLKGQEAVVTLKTADSDGTTEISGIIGSVDTDADGKQRVTLTSAENGEEIGTYYIENIQNIVSSKTENTTETAESENSSESEGSSDESVSAAAESEAGTGVA